ncbi:4-alpha-glucanotransferase [Kordiimonas sp.]|uniref:4-alpha-glucanotransferase n=1 Tax=Kordiimonas sp. TaxID=1970157 RepID=UPI003B51AC0C
MSLNADLLHEVCETLGVYHGYNNLAGDYITASDETKISQLAALNINTSNNQALEQELARITSEQNAPLPACLVVEQRPNMALPLQRTIEAPAPWTITLEDGDTLTGATSGHAIATGCILPLGYHQLEIRTGDLAQSCPLIVTPARTLDISSQTHRQRIWGLTVPLYGLTSSRNWGIGDFEDLAVMAERAAKKGADFIGLNPVHALFPSAPEMYSPYSPSSREFLNIMHIAPDRIDEFTRSKKGRMALDSLVNCPEYALAREAELVDYQRVYTLKHTAFEAAFSLFKTLSPNGPRHRAFSAFCERKGTALSRHALFDVIFELEQTRTGKAKGWQNWPEALQAPHNAAARHVAEQHADRVEYYCYLQWIAHEQLAEAQTRALAAGMQVGLYLDLAVGMVPGGAEAWGEKSAIVGGMSLGAPGDAANPDGQKWHLAPLDPIALRKSGYRIFAKTLREVMTSAGLVRIDHILGLNRAFWCPLDADLPGNYMTYPRDELLGIIALESVRNACSVVGEDLGTVPTGFREQLANKGLMGCSILYFEREGEAFKPAAHYDENRFASINNHDFPTLKGFWEEEDFGWREALGIGTNTLARDRGARFHDRWLLLKLLEAEGLLPEGISPDAAPAKLSVELAAAVHAFLAQSNAHTVAFQIEDLLGLKNQPNVPGTTTEQPNWRRKIPVPVENTLEHPHSRRIVEAIKIQRPPPFGE